MNLSTTKNAPLSSLANPVSTPYVRQNPTEILMRMEQFLNDRFLFRFNQLTDETVYKSRIHTDDSFRLVDQRALNTICIAAQREGINCWDKDIARYIYSENIAPFHPFTSYMESLPAWDGTDRLLTLAERVSDNALWVSGFHRWMLGMAAQWLQMDRAHGNSVAPVLVSRKQGLHKSTFCKMLLPKALQNYYTDSFDLASESVASRKLSEYGLINMDEFDKCAPRKMALLKNLMQMAQLNIRRAYKKTNSALPRMASFIATSNRFDLLSDPTGSRRFLCVEVTQKIDVSSINHTQIYAQLKAELEQGMPHWFDTLEEKALIQNNKRFQRTSPEEEVFHSCFRVATADEPGVMRLSLSEIFRHLKKHNAAAMSKTSLHGLSNTLIQLNAIRIHTKYGNLYRVISVQE